MSRLAIAAARLAAAMGMVIGCALATAAQVEAQQLTELRIGVREDARPFSYSVTDEQSKIKPGEAAAEAGEANTGSPPPVTGLDTLSGPLQAQGYRGYMIELCDQALAAMLRKTGDEARPFAVEPVVVLAANRFEKLEDDSTDGIDILCGPASLTDERLRRFLVSPPLYISSVSYASNPRRIQDSSCDVMVAFVQGTTAPVAGLEEIERSGVWVNHFKDREFNDAFINLKRTSHGEADNRDLSDECENDESDNNNTVNINESDNEKTDKDEANNRESNDSGYINGGRFFARYDSHKKLAKEFCSGSITYYIGDRDIIYATLQQRGCPFEATAMTFSEERYAVFARDIRGASADDQRKRMLILEMLTTLAVQAQSAHSSMDAAYDSSLGAFQQSRKLKFFYWAMRGERANGAGAAR